MILLSLASPLLALGLLLSMQWVEAHVMSGDQPRARARDARD